MFAEELPEFEELYHWIPNCLDAKISQADLSAYAILYVHGGVYADMDTMPLLPLDPLIDAALEAALGRDLVLLPTISRPDEDLEIRGVGGLEEPFSLDTDLMVSTAPRHPFFLEALRSIREYVVKHNQTVCGRDRRTPTYDLMFLTAWGRLSMLARSWQNGLKQSQLHFLESLFLREPVDATLVHLVLHVLPHHDLEDLAAQPPPRKHGARLERWLERMQRMPGTRKAKTLPLPEEYGEVQALFQGDDLILVPVAVSPAYDKRQLRELHLKCRDNSSCFRENVSSTAQQQFPERDPRNNFLLVFNDDGGIWEGSWTAAEQQQFRQAAAAAAATAREEL